MKTIFLTKALLKTGFIVSVSVAFFTGAASQSHDELVNRIQNKLAYSLGSVQLDNRSELSQTLFDLDSVWSLVDTLTKSTAIVSTTAQEKIYKALEAIEHALKTLQKDWGSQERKQQAAAQIKALEEAQKRLKVGIFDSTTTGDLKNALDVAIKSFLINLKNN